LDPALIRPGRVDVTEVVSHADATQIYNMFKRFFPDSDVTEEFCTEVASAQLSMAHLQGFFLLHKDSADEAMAGKFVDLLCFFQCCVEVEL
jgi:SpoVK/Ycf46/Vps4 family AAA+-type ATPase